jgi:tripartite-type tricarboxylate transporter receptor subunit TctC
MTAGGIENRRQRFLREAAMISRRALLAGASASVAGLATRAATQSYPERPIKLIVPFPAGGPVDVTACR